MHHSVAYKYKHYSFIYFSWTWDEIPRPLPVAPAAELLRKKLGDNEIWKHFWRFFNQTFLSLLTATIILFLTGYILAEAKEWTIYLDYRELFLLLPSHINLAILLELELAYNLLKEYE
ncbi:hypothetical protein BC829DRAFT_414291 [Chytridium lagenaria]|nr:hypothetical protein BC829DRAFT_414291 [Chytridium lagenaria]